MDATLVTGAARGLGLALATRLADAGGMVAAIVRQDSDALRQLAARHPGRVFTVHADLSRPQEAAGCVDAALALLPLAGCRSLTLINNAGTVAPMALAGHYPADELASALLLNLAAPMLCCDAFLRATAGLALPRRVLNISSGAAVKPYPGWGVYGASKAGLDHFSRTVAAEQAQAAHPASVVSLYPGVIDTGMQARIRATDRADFPGLDRFTALKADGALSSPEAAAAAIINYLAAPDFGSRPVVDIREL